MKKLLHIVITPSETERDVVENVRMSSRLGIKS